MTEKMRIELTLLLPAIPGAHDACVTRLSDLLRAKEGITDAHMVDSDSNVPGQLCVHFDPSPNCTHVRSQFHPGFPPVPAPIFNRA